MFALQTANARLKYMLLRGLGKITVDLLLRGTWNWLTLMAVSMGAAHVAAGAILHVIWKFCCSMINVIIEVGTCHLLVTSSISSSSSRRERAKTTKPSKENQNPHRREIVILRLLASTTVLATILASLLVPIGQSISLFSTDIMVKSLIDASLPLMPFGIFGMGISGVVLAVLQSDLVRNCSSGTISSNGNRAERSIMMMLSLQASFFAIAALVAFVSLFASRSKGVLGLVFSHEVATITTAFASLCLLFSQDDYCWYANANQSDDNGLRMQTLCPAFVIRTANKAIARLKQTHTTFRARKQKHIATKQERDMNMDAKDSTLDHRSIYVMDLDEEGHVLSPMMDYNSNAEVHRPPQPHSEEYCLAVRLGTADDHAVAVRCLDREREAASALSLPYNDKPKHKKKPTIVGMTLASLHKKQHNRSEWSKPSVPKEQGDDGRRTSNGGSSESSSLKENREEIELMLLDDDISRNRSVISDVASQSTLSTRSPARGLVATKAKKEASVVPQSIPENTDEHTAVDRDDLATSVCATSPGPKQHELLPITPDKAAANECSRRVLTDTFDEEDDDDLEEFFSQAKAHPKESDLVQATDVASDTHASADQSNSNDPRWTLAEKVTHLSSYALNEEDADRSRSGSKQEQNTAPSGTTSMTANEAQAPQPQENIGNWNIAAKLSSFSQSDSQSISTRSKSKSLATDSMCSLPPPPPPRKSMQAGNINASLGFIASIPNESISSKSSSIPPPPPKAKARQITVAAQCEAELLLTESIGSESQIEPVTVQDLRVTEGSFASEVSSLGAASVNEALERYAKERLASVPPTMPSTLIGGRIGGEAAGGLSKAPKLSFATEASSTLSPSSEQASAKTKMSHATVKEGVALDVEDEWEEHPAAAAAPLPYQMSLADDLSSAPGDENCTTKQEENHEKGSLIFQKEAMRSMASLRTSHSEESSRQDVSAVKSQTSGNSTATSARTLRSLNSIPLPFIGVAKEGNVQTEMVHNVQAEVAVLRSMGSHPLSPQNSVDHSSSSNESNPSVDASQANVLSLALLSGGSDESADGHDKDNRQPDGLGAQASKSTTTHDNDYNQDDQSMSPSLVEVLSLSWVASGDSDNSDTKESYVESVNSRLMGSYFYDQVEHEAQEQKYWQENKGGENEDDVANANIGKDTAPVNVYHVTYEDSSIADGSHPSLATKHKKDMIDNSSHSVSKRSSSSRRSERGDNIHQHTRLHVDHKVDEDVAADIASVTLMSVAEDSAFSNNSGQLPSLTATTGSRTEFIKQGALGAISPYSSHEDESFQEEDEPGRIVSVQSNTSEFLAKQREQALKTYSYEELPLTLLSMRTESSTEEEDASVARGGSLESGASLKQKLNMQKKLSAIEIQDTGSCVELELDWDAISVAPSTCTTVEDAISVAPSTCTTVEDDPSSNTTALAEERSIVPVASELGIQFIGAASSFTEAPSSSASGLDIDGSYAQLTPWWATEGSVLKDSNKAKSNNKSKPKVFQAPKAARSKSKKHTKTSAPGNDVKTS
jgi:hypothetical protein